MGRENGGTIGMAATIPSTEPMTSLHFEIDRIWGATT